MTHEKQLTTQEKYFMERTGETFSYFYEKFYPGLVWRINSIVKDEHLAEDVASVAFMDAYEKIHLYKKELSQFSTWVTTIGKNLALQELKKSRKTMSIDISLDDEGTTMKDFIKDENTDELLQVQQLTLKKSEIVLAHIETLKQPYKNIIEMREIKQMSYRDIAIEQGRDIEFIIKGSGFIEHEISSIYSITDDENNLVEYSLLKEINHENLYTTIEPTWFNFIKIDSKGRFNVKAREPKNLSTIKSQISCARKLLEEQTKQEFELLDKIME